MTVRPISISTLSPIHIGCDEVYEPTNFVITDGLLHAFDPAIAADELTDRERKQLAGLVDEREPISAMQRFFFTNAARFAALAHHQVSVAPAIIRQYAESMGRPMQQGKGGESIYNRFPISRTAYRTLDNGPYLPGSSIKGSIRTAWLNQINQGAGLNDAEKSIKDGKPVKDASRRMQERLLNYSVGKFEMDPFRHVGLADAQPQEGDAPPTQVRYAISKSKRFLRTVEGNPRTPYVFLEVVPEALPEVFLGELRLSSAPENKVSWDGLCDACKNFYKLEDELNDAALSPLLDGGWRRLMNDLLANELGELIAERQGFLLRIGRHSGAESVTVDGVRHIKILGKNGEPPTHRPHTTAKRFASRTKEGAENLMPFGWIWVDGSDDAHRYLFEAVREKLAAHSGDLRQAHRERLIDLDQKRQRRAAVAAEAALRRKAAEDAARVQAEEQEARQAALATMSPNFRRIEEFKAAFAARAEQLRGGKDNPNTAFHVKARDLAKDAADWSTEEKYAAADAIEEWLPRVVKVDIKDERKKLKLSALRGS